LRRSSSTCESSTTMEEGSRAGWRGSSQWRRRPPSASPLSRRGLSSKIAGPDHEHGRFRRRPPPPATRSISLIITGRTYVTAPRAYLIFALEKRRNQIKVRDRLRRSR
jgi:hypothetical protein